MSEFDVLSIAADGMSVQRTLLDVAARNVAAAQASTPAHPYRRLVARFAEGAGDATPLPQGDPDGRSADPDGIDDDAPRTRFVGPAVGAESADALTEMIAVLEAQRAYESGASVFDVGKRLAERTIDVGRL